ncbi:MAG TPA: beta-N-acetylhexosaminidase [Saprospiraceae bacterium]|nr:beta-N-acetylhexosaminidase [Saprospiraceae bacterium]
MKNSTAYNMALCFVAIFLSFSNAQVSEAIIPQPKSISYGHGYIAPSDIRYVSIQEDAGESLKKLAEMYASVFGNKLEIKSHSNPKTFQDATIILAIKADIYHPEAYQLRISKGSISVTASQEVGLFYALQSLTQLIDFAGKNETTSELKIPYVVIDDEPEFAYRGMHLDVSRHFFPVQFIKEYIDYMARYKFNNFHWHLTDDQGWRIEIKKYPLLTQVGSKRKETLIGSYADMPQRYDGKEYGSYYSQDQIRDIVRYAQSKYIEIIPEIEMPGHSLAALAAYPEFGCTGGPYEVATSWGVFDNVFCSKDSTLGFVKDILSEVSDLFPGKYIHIGGDECPKTAWKACTACNDNMRKKGIKTYEELQSYFISQIDLFLSKKNKKIIGWDEILDGGLSPQSTVMSWRGMEGGVAAARQKHDAIMTPTSHCYFDYYQSPAKSEPLAIGGLTTLQKVYNFEPIPEQLKPEEKRYILGGQANLWTEYIETGDKAIYMAYPRAMALSEALWTPKSQKSYPDFVSRMRYHYQWFANRSYKLSTAYLDLSYRTRSSLADTNCWVIFEKPPLAGKILAEARYAGDYNQYYLTKDSFKLKESTTFKTWYQAEDNTLGKPLEIRFLKHLGCTAEVQMSEKPSPKYFLTNESSLINGIDAPENKYSGQEWIGWDGKDADLTFAWNTIQKISSIKIQNYHLPGAWIHQPQKITVFSKQGSDSFKPVKTLEMNKESSSGYKQISIDLDQPIETKDLRILISNHGKIESGQAGEGHGSWLFVGEIRID